MIDFRCNICGVDNRLPEAAFHREAGQCTGCGANARFRGMMLGLCLGLYGASRALHDLPEDQRLSGIGCSDHDIYARPLARLFAYVNTFFDRAPRLDLGKPASAQHYLPADFVICSDVLEHVAPPVSEGFATLHQMLRPGGLLVFSVPSYDMPTTLEHFPDYHEAALVRLGGHQVLVNRRRDGSAEIFEDLVFHGGEGATLEMRRFAQVDVLAGLKAAGFTDIVVLAPDRPDIGYWWPAEPLLCAEVIIARAGPPPS